MDEDELEMEKAALLSKAQAKTPKKRMHGFILP